LAGAVLLGHFPDAYVVRTCNWRRRGDVTPRNSRADAAVHRDCHSVRRVQQGVAHRADIVLSDLDGRWEDVYVEARTRLTSTYAVFDGPAPSSGGRCLEAATGGVIFQDFFLVSDGKLELRRLLDAEGEGYAVFLDDRAGDHEVSPDDRDRSNIIARPDVRVSRLVARGAAPAPRGDVVDVDGEGLLDVDGIPRTVTFADPADVPRWRELWTHDDSFDAR